LVHRMVSKRGMSLGGKDNIILHTKTYIILLLLLVILTVSFPSLVLADDRLSEVLDGILKRYKNLPGLVVSYQREIITKSMAILDDDIKSDIASGNFMFKPPNYLKVVQELPGKEIVTTDGQTIWWYIPDKKLVYRYPADTLGKELRLLSDIFNGLSDVGDGFDASLTVSDNKEEYQLVLVPTDPWEEIDHISLYVRQDDFNILIVEIYNFLGTVTRFKLGDFSVRKSFEKDFFRFVVPDGIEVIEQD